MADPLEAAARAFRRERFGSSTEPTQWDRADATLAVTAYLDSLLGELPEEAVEALMDGAFLDEDRNLALAASQEYREDAASRAAQAFLRSLRDSLASGRPENDDG